MNKIDRILVCPNCLQASLAPANDDKMVCTNCSESYDHIQGRPFLLPSHSDIKIDFFKTLSKPKKKSLLSRIPLPSQRLWTHSSLKLVAQILRENDPADQDTYVMNMGSGGENVYRKLFQPYDQSIIRVGLPHDGKIDVFGDAMGLPLATNSIDVLLSSSVFEHIKNPEKAAAEIFRVLKPGGKVYAEIPFMRGFHMEPIDYQRYTIEGIEQLFERHGLRLIKKGICSGTFNTWALFLVDFWVSIAPKGTKFPVRFLVSWLTHPLKYLDRFFERSKWNYKLACNFYYYGEKP